MKSRMVAVFRNKDGFTLIEVILTTALAGIFFTAIAVILPGWLKSYQEVMNTSYAVQMADSIVSAVEGQISYASDVVVKSEGGKYTLQYLAAGDKEIPVQSTIKLGIVSGQEDGEVGPVIPGFVYDKDYFMGNIVYLEAEMSDSGEGGKICSFTVNISKSVRDGQDEELITATNRKIRLYGKIS